MTGIIMPLRIGENPVLQIQIYDSETGAVDPIISASAISAKATNSDTGDVENFTTATLSDAANAIFDLGMTTGTFTVIGIYDVLLTYTDSSGNVQKYPKTDGNLKLKVS